MIIDYLSYDDAIIYSGIFEQLYIEFYKIENGLFNLLEFDVQKQVMTIIYKVILSNKENVEIGLDNELLDELTKDFNSEFPFNFKEI